MAFYLKRTLETGRIRFSVDPIRPRTGTRTGLSTGPKGEFLRRSVPTLYFSEDKPILSPIVKKMGVAPPPPTGRQKWTPGQLATMAAGVVLILLGIAVLASKGAQGWIEIVIGVALIATPPILTAARRREARIRYETERKEREEQERKERETVAELNEKLQRLEERVDAASLADVEAHRVAAGIPYQVLSPAGRRALAKVAFQRIGAGNFDAAAVEKELEDLAASTGLNDEDFRYAKREILQKVIWHLIADGSLDPTSLEDVRKLQDALEVTDAELGREKRAIAALAEAKRSLEPQGAIDLPGGDVAYHRTSGAMTVMPKGSKWNVFNSAEASEKKCDLIVTKTGVIFDRDGLTHQEIADVEVDVDDGSVTIIRRDAGDPVRFVVPDAVKTGLILSSAMIESESTR